MMLRQLARSSSGGVLNLHAFEDDRVGLKVKQKYRVLVEQEEVRQKDQGLGEHTDWPCKYSFGPGLHTSRADFRENCVWSTLLQGSLPGRASTKDNGQKGFCIEDVNHKDFLKFRKDLPGRTSSSGQLAPAIMRLIQNIHRHSLVEEKPAMIGPTSGPMFDVKPRIITAVPRGRRSGYRSLNMPPRTA